MTVPDSCPTSPRPFKEISSKRNAFIAGAIAVTILIVILLVGIPVMFPDTQPLGDGHLETALGTNVNQTSTGNWTITITRGSKQASSVRLMVFNQTIGLDVVNKVVSKLAPARNDPDAVFNDCNANSKLDAKDTIILKSSGGLVATGYTVRFLQNNHIIGTIMGLP